MDCHTAAAQSRRRQRAADNVAKRDVECPLDLAETRERVPRIAFPETYPLDREELPPVPQKFVVEPPPSRVGSLATEPRLIEFRIVPLVKQLQRRIFVQPQILLARRHSRTQPRTQLLHHRLQFRHNAPHIGARLRMLRAVAPHRLAFDEFVAQHGPLHLHALRQKRIGIPQPRNALQQRPLRGRHKLSGTHTFNVHPSAIDSARRLA